MADKLHICVIGLGEIVQKAHAPSLKKLSEKVDISFSSRDRNKAKEFCTLFSGKNAYQGVDEVLKDSNINAVSICLPHNQHRDVAIACADAKKHVLLEKPITCTLREAEDVIAACKENKVKLAIAESRGYSRVVKKAKELLDQKEIGEFRAIFCTQILTVQPRTWRKNIQEMGGGALIDGGVHTIDVFHQIGGPITEVFSMMPPHTLSEMAGEDTTITTMRFKNKGVGQFNYSWSHPGVPEEPTFQIFGTEGTLYEQNGLHLIQKKGRKILIPMKPGLSDNYDWMMEDFVECIIHNYEPQMTGEMGRQDLAVALAAYESAESKCPVSVKN